MNDRVSLRRTVRDVVLIGSTLSMATMANSIGKSSDLFSNLTAQKSRSSRITLPIGNGDSLITAIKILIQ